jgi:hypothetical protein
MPSKINTIEELRPSWGEYHWLISERGMTEEQFVKDMEHRFNLYRQSIIEEAVDLFQDEPIKKKLGRPRKSRGLIITKKTLYTNEQVKNKLLSLRVPN